VRKILVAFLLGILIALGPPGSRAQFRGYVSYQTLGPITLLSGVTTPQASASVPARGQASHYLIYRTTGTIAALSIQLEGSIDGTNWLTISEVATNTVSGAVFANVYLPFIRARATILEGGGALTATYTASSVTAGPPYGMFSLNNNILAVAKPADTNKVYTFSPPAGNTLGNVSIKFSAAVTGATIAVAAGPDVNHLTPVLLPLTLAPVATIQLAPIAGVPANIVQVTYTAPGPTAATVDVTYQAQDTPVVQRLDREPLARSRAGPRPNAAALE